MTYHNRKDSVADYLPEAIFGGMLWGSKAVRFIHVDEAGTSEHEPVTVVVGLIIDADKQLLAAERAVAEVMGSVPKEFSEGFVFHATDIWGSEKYREKWSFSDRLGIMRRMMSLPRRLGIPVSLSIVRRTLGRDGVPDHITTAQYHHLMAFANCMASADKYIRDFGELSEIGTVIAEDVPKMKKFLRAAVNVWRNNPIVLPPNSLKPTEEEQQIGYIKQEGEYRVSRIRKSIHFVEKGEDVLTEMADACAFGFRRFFAEESFGKEFVQSILGFVPPLADYSGKSSIATFRWHP